MVIPSTNNEIVSKLNWVYKNIYTMLYNGEGEPKCKHEETIDIGDEEHSVIACTQCEKIL